MDFFSKDIVSALIVSIGAIAAAYIAVTRGLKSFYTQKWWEKKSEIYSNMYKQVYELKKVFQEYSKCIKQMDLYFNNDTICYAGQTDTNTGKVLSEKDAAFINNQERLRTTAIHELANKEQDEIVKILPNLIEEFKNYCGVNAINIDFSKIPSVELFINNISGDVFSNSGPDATIIVAKNPIDGKAGEIDIVELLTEAMKELKDIAKKELHHQ
mgnify:FL=1